jgi:hypothetical protein
LNLVLEAKARKFNFSSLFVDERDNDLEPNLPPIPSSNARHSPSLVGRTPYAVKPDGVKGKPNVERSTAFTVTTGNGARHDRPAVKAITNGTLLAPSFTTQSTQSNVVKRIPTTSGNPPSSAQRFNSIAGTPSVPQAEPIAEPVDQALDQLHASELHVQQQPNQVSSFDLKRLPKTYTKSSPARRTRPGSEASTAVTGTKKAIPAQLGTPDTSSYTMHVLPLSAPIAELLTNFDRPPSSRSTGRKVKSSSNGAFPCRKSNGKDQSSRTTTSWRPIEQTQIDLDDRAAVSRDSWPIQSILDQMQTNQFQFHPLGRSLYSLPTKSLASVARSADRSTPTQLLRYRRELMMEADQDEPTSVAAGSSDQMPEEVCRSRHMYITPKSALNDRSEWRYIVNLGDKDNRLRQVIKVDVCA